nr:hypothetical protein [Streptomyces clavuligerus]
MITQTSDQLDGQVAQDPGQAHHVVAGVHHDQDVPVTRLPLAGRDQPSDHGPQLAGGDRRGIVRGADHVQDLRPRRAVRGERAATNDYGQPGTT